MRKFVVNWIYIAGRGKLQGESGEVAHVVLLELETQSYTEAKTLDISSEWLSIEEFQFDKGVLRADGLRRSKQG